MNVTHILIEELRSDKIEDGFLEIKDLSATVVKSLKLIEAPYKGHYCEIFKN